MKRLRLLMLVFCVALTIPLVYFVVRTQRSLAQEELAELSFFAQTMFDEMENELAELVEREESRPFEDYLSGPPLPANEPYILGYFQNNPDGSFHSRLTPPFQAGLDRIQADEASDDKGAASQERLRVVNEILNLKRAEGMNHISSGEKAESAPVRVKQEAKKPAPVVEKKAARPKDRPSVADRYLDTSKIKRKRDFLGQAETRKEQISLDQYNQALNRRAAQDSLKSKAEPQTQREVDSDISAGRAPLAEAAPQGFREETPQRALPAPSLDKKSFEIEVDPLQSIFIDQDQIFIFRRIMIDNKVYRQGFVLKAREFMRHLAGIHFADQPMSRFAALRLSVFEPGGERGAVRIGAEAANPVFHLERVFPRPFSFLKGEIVCQEIPRSSGRATLSLMMAALLAVILLGLFGIYQSARVVMELSQRRSQFVSSVTHELKTPLTNIRMYIEMLEQGMARTPEREQDYFRILGSESSRLSRLINNVLEFSKLEVKKRVIEPKVGDFREAVREIIDVMREKLKQEGFSLRTDMERAEPFPYDREAMVQVLINLIENSVKFGRTAEKKEIILRVEPDGDWMRVSVTDTGPGVPPGELKRIFDDFHRVDNSLTRKTRGTGIGLALVRRFARAMGGRVEAANIPGAGLCVSILLPRKG